MSEDGVAEVLGEERAEALDAFDRVQLAEVIRVCRGARSMSEAGRVLFAASRAKKRSQNDADRLRKYLGRFSIEWGDLAPSGAGRGLGADSSLVSLGVAL